MRENKEKITRDFCRGRTLLFYPATAVEAEFIQQKIFELGFTWDEGGTTIGRISGEDCVKHGMVFRNNKLWYGPAETSREGGYLCTAEQFGEKYLSPDQIFFLEHFNRLSAKIDALTAELAEVRKAVVPQSLDKPSFKKPEPGAKNPEPEQGPG